MTFTKKFMAVALAAAMLSGCTTTTGGTKQTMGTIGGAVAGGLLGAQVGKGKGQIIAAGVGTLLGALVGAEIGASLDRADQLAIENASQRALDAPIGQTIAWSGSEYGSQTGAHGTVVATRQGHDTTSGAYCREYQQTIVIGGRNEQAYGTACRQPDGSWQVVN